MNFTLIITVVLTFFIFLVAVKLHESYIKTTIFYNETMYAMAERKNELEITVVESIKLSSNFKTTISENQKICGKNPDKECDLCDGDCLFGKESGI